MSRPVARSMTQGTQYQQNFHLQQEGFIQQAQNTISLKDQRISELEGQITYLKEGGLKLETTLKNNLLTEQEKNRAAHVTIEQLNQQLTQFGNANPQLQAQIEELQQKIRNGEASLQDAINQLKKSKGEMLTLYKQLWTDNFEKILFAIKHDTGATKDATEVRDNYSIEMLGVFANDIQSFLLANDVEAKGSTIGFSNDTECKNSNTQPQNLAEGSVCAIIDQVDNSFKYMYHLPQNEMGVVNIELAYLDANVNRSSANRVQLADRLKFLEESVFGKIKSLLFEYSILNQSYRLSDEAVKNSFGTSGYLLPDNFDIGSVGNIMTPLIVNIMNALQQNVTKYEGTEAVNQIINVFKQLQWNYIINQQDGMLDQQHVGYLVDYFRKFLCRACVMEKAYQTVDQIAKFRTPHEAQRFDQVVLAYDIIFGNALLVAAQNRNPLTLFKFALACIYRTHKDTPGAFEKHLPIQIAENDDENDLTIPVVEIAQDPNDPSGITIKKQITYDFMTETAIYPGECFAFVMETVKSIAKIEKDISRVFKLNQNNIINTQIAQPVAKVDDLNF